MFRGTISCRCYLQSAKDPLKLGEGEVLSTTICALANPACSADLATLISSMAPPHAQIVMKTNATPKAKTAPTAMQDSNKAMAANVKHSPKQKDTAGDIRTSLTRQGKLAVTSHKKSASKPKKVDQPVPEVAHEQPENDVNALPQSNIHDESLETKTEPVKMTDITNEKAESNADAEVEKNTIPKAPSQKRKRDNTTKEAQSQSKPRAKRPKVDKALPHFGIS